MFTSKKVFLKCLYCGEFFHENKDKFESREKGKINSQVMMENLRQGVIIKFIPVNDKISILAGELKCKHKFLSTVDAVIIAEALTRNIFIYTTETHFYDVENLKVKKIDFD